MTDKAPDAVSPAVLPPHRIATPLRIGVDIASLLKPRTGVGEYTFNLVRSLARLSNAQFVLFYNSFRGGRLEGLVEGLDGARIQVKRSRFPRLLLALAWQTLPFPPADWFTGPVDILHSPNYRVFPVRHSKLVVTVLDLVVLKFPQYQFLTRVKDISGSLRKLHRADAIVAISENTRRDILELLDVEPEKVHVIYPGYDAALFRPDVPELEAERVRLHYRLPSPYVLYLGTLEPRKNLVRLLRAFHGMVQKGGDDISLALAGLKGWDYDEVFREIQRLKITDRVRYLGYVPDGDRPGLIKGARVLAYPSLYEGFGLPPLEAMAVGTPVLTSNTSSLPEVMGEAGVMVDPEDEEAMADALQRLCQDESLREELRQRGWRQAQRFSWDRAARETMELYLKLLGQGE